MGISTASGQSQSDVILDELLDLAVNVNGLLVSGRAFQDFAGRFITNLTVWTHDNDFKVQLRGTSTLIEYRNRFFMLATQHQLKGVNYEDVGILDDDGKNLISSGGMRAFLSEDLLGRSDAYDVIAFDFTEPVSAGVLQRSKFFSFRDPPPDNVSSNILALVSSGFPTEHQDYDLYENNALGLTRVSLTAELSHQPSDLAQLTAKYVKKIDFSPDGLSGGSVFVVLLNNQRPYGYFAGLVQRSGCKSFHFLKSGYIKSFLDSFVE